MCKENLYAKMEKLKVQIFRCTRQILKVSPHGRAVSVGQTLLPYKAKEDDVIYVETRKVDIVTNSGTR